MDRYSRQTPVVPIQLSFLRGEAEVVGTIYGAGQIYGLAATFISAYSGGTMEGNEYDIFSHLEQEMGRDLSEWRSRIVTRFEQCRRAALEIEIAKAGAALDLNNSTVIDRVKNRILEFIIAEWIDEKESPGPGDLIAVTGESYWRMHDEESEQLVIRRLPIGHKIEGALLHLDILPYIDEAGLVVLAHSDPELEAQHTHHFGLHLVLHDPTIVNEVGTLLPIHPEQVYVPIHYERAKLRAYASE